MFKSKNFRIVTKQKSPKSIFCKYFKKKYTKFYKKFENGNKNLEKTFT